MRTENISHRQAVGGGSSDAGTASPATPRLLNRKNGAAYMGVCVKTFDKIRHLFAVKFEGVIRYDREMIDRYIERRKWAA